MVEFEKTMFQGLVWHFQPIFVIWTSTKCNLGEIKKGLFWFLQDTANSFSASRPASDVLGLA